jgi:hypothetical protein
MPTNAYIMVFRDFFIFSSSPVASMNQIPHQVIAITASIHVKRIKKEIILAIAISHQLFHVSVIMDGRLSVGFCNTLSISNAETHTT